MNKSCANCYALYHGQIPGQANVIGHQCRRHPPQVMMIPRGVDLAGNMKMSIDALWPVVNLKGPEDPGCADWLPAEPSFFVGRPDPGLNS